jgi:hypothetical protein
MNALFLLADSPGQKLQETVGAEIGSLFLLACMTISAWLFWQRQFTKFIGFILFAMLVSVFIFTPSLVQTLGTDAFYWLFEGLIR